MNEQIETLAKVAGYDMINKAAMRALGFDVEKFAELIIRECMSIAEENQPRDVDWNVSDIIRVHFGVEK